MLNLGLGPAAVAVRQRFGVIAPWLASIDAAGWSGQAAAVLALPAMTADGTSEFGADGVAPKTLAVLRQGFDATGAATSFVEPVTITKRVRQPYPNHASATAATVALSDYVFAADAVAGCANASAEVSPRPVTVWSRPDRQVVTASDTAAVVAFHRCGVTLGNLGIACVVFSWTDGTNMVTATVTTPTVGGHPGDLNPVIEFVASNIDLSSLAAGAITRNARIYPKVGTAASVLDSAANVAGTRAFAPQTVFKSAAAVRYAYVSVSGADAAGVTSTTAASAAAAPFLTVKAAIEKLKTDNGTVDGCIVRIGAGTFALSSLTAGTYQGAGELIIERDPAVTRAQAVLSWGVSGTSVNFNGISWLRLRDLSLLKTGNTVTLRIVTGGQLVLENVNFDNAGYSSLGIAGLTGSAGARVCFLGATITNPANSALTNASNDVMLMRGVNYGTLAANSLSVETWAVLGSVLRGVVFTPTAKPESGTVIAFNRLMGLGGSAIPLEIGSAGSLNGYAIVQNVFEWSAASSNVTLGISRDGKAGNVQNVILWHNSFAGFFNQGRANLFYDELAGTNRTHKLNALAGNLHVALNTKHDWFLGANGNGTPNPGDAPNHVGGWSALYGVGSRGEFARYGDAGTGSLGTMFSQAYAGPGARIGTAQSGAGQDPLFTGYAGTTTAGAAGAGNGDYTIAGGSPAKAALSGGPLAGLPDLVGVTRTGAESAGAYQ